MTGLATGDPGPPPQSGGQVPGMGGLADPSIVREPILAADVGSVVTRAYLLEVVGGSRRLIAIGECSTLGDDGVPDVRGSLSRALSECLRAGGRTWADAPRERALITSAGSLPRVAVIAPSGDDAAIATGELESLPLVLLEPMVLDGQGLNPDVLTAYLESGEPDIVVLMSGSRPIDHERARGAVESIGLGLAITAPYLILAGDVQAFESLRPMVESQLAGMNQVTRPEPQPILQAVGRRIMESLYQRWHDPADREPLAKPGGSMIIHSSLHGVCVAARNVGDRYDVDVLAVHAGATYTMASSYSGPINQRRGVNVVRDDVGSSTGRLALLKEVGASSISRWLPYDIDEEALTDHARRVQAAPWQVPVTVRDLLIDHAFNRESLRVTLERLARRFDPERAWRAGARGVPKIPAPDLLIGSGGALARTPRLAQAVLQMLDAVQPAALTQLALDRATAMSLLGVLGYMGGTSAVGSELEHDVLLSLGICVAPVGVGNEGETAIRVVVSYSDKAPVEIDVPFGVIEVLPLPLGERAALRLYPSREFDVGLGRGEAAAPRVEVQGGAVGIVIDCRGRPLQLPDDDEKRQAKLLQWFQAMRAYPPLSFVEGG